jgi:hypothetical protein
MSLPRLVVSCLPVIMSRRMGHLAGEKQARLPLVPGAGHSFHEPREAVSAAYRSGGITA